MASEENFGFAYNDSVFLDRIIRLETLNSNFGIVKLTTLHISSVVLASKSPFFYKLFNNGMRESLNRNEVTVRIDSSDEAAFMDLIKFMYDEPLGANSVSDLRDVLMLANNYGVTSCIKYCVELLQKMPMSLESALQYVELIPSTIELPSTMMFVRGAFQPLIDSAKQYLATRYKDFTKFQQAEAMTLPLSAIKVILGSDDLQVDTEDDLFEFVLEWVRSHYPYLYQRQEIIKKHFARLIRFPYLSPYKLKEARICPEFGDEHVSRIVLEAFFIKIEAAKGLATTISGHLYNHRPIKVVPFEFSQPRCVVYFDLKQQECTNLIIPSKVLSSESFKLGGKWFYLAARRSSVDHFNLSLHWTARSETCTIDFEISVMRKTLQEFQYVGKEKNYTLTDVAGPGALISWIDFIKDDSEYFTNGILHVRLDLTIKNSLS